MVTKADILAAFAEVSKNNKNTMNNVLPAPTTQAYNDSYVAPKVDPLPAGAFGGKGQEGNDIPIWMKAMHGVSGIGHLITQNFANWSDGDLNVHDIPLADSLVQGASGQLEAWRDGKLGFGDIPFMGALYGSGKYGDGFGKTLTNLGAKEGGAIEKWGGLAGDIAFDPVNFVTLGAGSAIKAGARASQIAAQDLAKTAGLSAGRNAAKEVPDILSNAVKARYANNTVVNPALVERLAAKKAADASKTILQAGAKARNSAQNAAFSLDIPFTKITKQFGTKPNFLKIIDPKIGVVGSAAASDLFRTLGLDVDSAEDAAKIKGLLENTYGVSRAEDLSTQGWEHLKSSVDDYTSKFKANDGTAKNFLNDFDIDEVTSYLKNPKYNPKMDGNLHIGNDAEPFLQSLSRTVEPKPFKIEAPDTFMSKFIQDMGGTSKLGQMVGKINPFNPRTFNAADPLANTAANNFRNTQGKIAGQTRQTNEQLSAINNSMKDFTQAEKDAIPYYIENAFPRSFKKTSIDEAKVKQVAESMKSILKTIGDRDLESGVVKQLRRGYFPHVLKPDVKGFDGDPDIARLLGKSQKAGAGIERTGFESLAQLDDAVETLRNEALADPARADELLEKVARLKGLFERDPMTALGNRAQESIRASAMADLFKTMEKDGLLVKGFDDMNIDRATHAGDDIGKFHKLSKEEAGAMGLPAGSLVHPDVFDGMKSVNELFTVKGVNNFVDNVNKAISVWKTLVTSYVPAHYVNNFIGNVANNTMAGVKPASYAEASRLLKGYKAGTLSEADQKLMQQAFDNNVLGGGFSSEFVRSKFATDKVSKADKIVESITNNGYAKMMRKGGEKIDDFSRMALFLHGMDSTGSATKASELVSKYLFNYNISNNADKYARTVMPFWNWTKNNLPLQIQGILQQPRFYETYNRIRETFNEDVDAPEGKEYQTTDYLHIPGTNIGAPLRSLPMNDLNRFKENPLDVLRSFMGDLSPALKVLPETTLNKQFFNNKPIYYPDEKPAPAIGDYLLRQTGALDKLVNVAGSQDGSSILQNLAAIFGGKPIEYK